MDSSFTFNWFAEHFLLSESTDANHSLPTKAVFGRIRHQLFIKEMGFVHRIENGFCPYNTSEGM
jgi:hypothetical protein